MALPSYRPENTQLFTVKNILKLEAGKINLKKLDDLKVLILCVLLHRDQHFIERESYRSGREMALEIQGKSWYITCTISPLCCVMANRGSGPCYQLSLLPSRCRARAGVEGVSATIPSGSLDLEGEGLSARSCLRDSQAICSFQESLETITCNKDIDNKDRNHLQRTWESARTVSARAEIVRDISTFEQFG